MINWSALLMDLSRQEFILGMFFLSAGLVFLLWGLRVYSILVVVSLVAINTIVCIYLPLLMHYRILLAGLIGLILLFFGWRLTKIYVGLLVSAWAAVIPFTVLDTYGVRPEISLTIALFFVAAVISMVFILFEQAIALVTSFEGALLCLAGMVNLAGQSPRVWDFLQPMLLGNAFFTPFLVVAITFSGFYFQMAEYTRQKTGMSG
ncbi:MAG: hypothetical protein GXY44_12525 [Phycisphaerales bacterium]|mgnify:CR=1 FL=1|nr:hypothetical protein [Phycisphaerales bacterium]